MISTTFAAGALAHREECSFWFCRGNPIPARKANGRNRTECMDARGLGDAPAVSSIQTVAGSAGSWKVEQSKPSLVCWVYRRLHVFPGGIPAAYFAPGRRRNH